MTINLIINGCAFPAEPPPPYLNGTEEDKREERMLFARECLERISILPISVQLAGGPATKDKVEIVQWALPYVAKHYDVHGEELYTAWMHHSGPLEVQILLNQALAEAVTETLKRRKP